MLRKAAFMMFAMAALACTALAQDHPDISGTWKLNSAKSDPGNYGPTARTDVITIDGAKLSDKVTSSTQMGESDYTLTATIDGTKVTVAPGSPQANMGTLTLKELTAAWDGPALVVTTLASFQGQVDVATQSHDTLSADGKVLTMAMHASTSMGDFDETLVFDKQ
jgi:hypothetical protein